MLNLIPNLNNNTILGLALIIGLILVINRLYLKQRIESFCGGGDVQSIGYPRDREYGDFGYSHNTSKEEFVPWNSEEVGNYEVSQVKLDQSSLVKMFESLVSEDKGKVDTSFLTEFRDQPHGTDQAKAYINHVLARMNRASGRKFHILDVQVTNKQSAIDPRSNDIIERWTSELFIQDNQSQEVRANAMNISMEMYVKSGTVQITKLHFITDYFYQRPLVGGQNVHKKYFRIKNPFHLQKPFFTSDDQVIPDTYVGDQLLVDHHKDLRTPQYRCFQESGEMQDATQDSCNVSSGYWDKPVDNDSECPFFMANKNYPNRLGGVNPNTKRCEMPIGTKTIGYRYISNDPQHQPMCYNCHVGADGMPGSAGKCCAEQRNKELYPNLNGPDYMFNDVIERGQYWKVLKERGLNWQAHPTHIRDITDPLQKQPVFNSFIGPGPGEL